MAPCYTALPAYVNRLSPRIALWATGIHMALLFGLWRTREGLEVLWGPSDFLGDPNWDWAYPLLGTADVILGLPLFYPTLALIGDFSPVYELAFVLNSTLWGIGAAVVFGRLRLRHRAV
ncbi:MAG: hypothetical protein Rubg2KO_06810 [Rubricoccaceae bacterium]